jgi:biotin-dependent carboxylase-like uncharacterized protein
MSEVCQVLATGLGITVQDEGRPGWRRFGVPASGAMDSHAAAWANRLVGNPGSAPVLELLGGGARIQFFEQCWIAVAGASACASIPNWHSSPVAKGTEIRFAHPQRGMWSYLAVEGAFESAHWMGSASVCARSQVGMPLKPGDTLRACPHPSLALPAGVSGRLAPWTEQRDYRHPPPLRVWPGPQWDRFAASERDAFFAQAWTVSSRSDRTGYRLTGEPLRHEIGELISEPVLPGTIQVPQNGQPIVTMHDGPTVGGYPKLGLLDFDDIAWLAQVQPGQQVQFKPVTDL